MKPPVFIAVKEEDGAISGFIRADRIEVVLKGDAAATQRYARVCTFSGAVVYTHETIDHVFAKMADALNVESEEDR
jgi:hypothetical protein